MANPMRRQRVAEQIHQELGKIIQSEIRDPRLGWTTVTRVDMSPDLCHAKVYVSIFGEEEAQEVSLKVLTRAQAYIRGQLGHRIRLRTVPELHFRLDHSLEHSQRIMDLLKEEREREERLRSGAGPAGGQVEDASGTDAEDAAGGVGS